MNTQVPKARNPLPPPGFSQIELDQIRKIVSEELKKVFTIDARSIRLPKDSIRLR